MSYAQGSTVISQGNIYVVGEGCYHCHLQARHHIVISGNPGYCRESRIEAGGNLVVRELGSPNNSHLHIKLQETSHVWARLIYPGVEIRFGMLEPFYVMERMDNVEIYVAGEQVRVRLVNFQAL